MDGRSGRFLSEIEFPVSDGHMIFGWNQVDTVGPHLNPVGHPVDFHRGMPGQQIVHQTFEIR